MLNIILFILLIIIAILIIINISFNANANVLYSGGGGSDDERIVPHPLFKYIIDDMKKKIDMTHTNILNIDDIKEIVNINYQTYYGISDIWKTHILDSIFTIGLYYMQLLKREIYTAKTMLSSKYWPLLNIKNTNRVQYQINKILKFLKSKKIAIDDKFLDSMTDITKLDITKLDIENIDISIFFKIFITKFINAIDIPKLHFLILLLKNDIFIEKILKNEYCKFMAIDIFFKILCNIITIRSENFFTYTTMYEDTLEIINFIKSYLGDKLLILIDMLSDNIPDKFEKYILYCTLLKQITIEYIAYNIPLYNKFNKNQIFKLYTAIEIDFTNNKFIEEKMEIYKKIMDYVNYLIKKDKEDSPEHQYLLYDNDPSIDNNRDKLLNNLCLLIIGVTETNYICILLYPMIFTEFKKYQKEKEDTNFGNINLYKVDKKTQTKFRKGVFEGGGSGRCTIKNCSCIGFMAKSEIDPDICYYCNHPYDAHLDMGSSAVSQSKKYSVMLENLKEYNKINFLKASKFGKDIVDILHSNIDNYPPIPFFQIPMDKNFTKHWRPMSIKALDDAFFDNIYDTAKRFFIDAHGAVPSGNDIKTIDLRDNEIVIMSCAPNEPTAMEPRHLLLLFYDNKNHKKLLIRQLNRISSTNTINRSSAEASLSGVLYRNNFCIYTKKCPNLRLQFYNRSGNQFMKSIPRAVFEYPIQFKFNTVGDLLDILHIDKNMPIESPIYGLSLQNHTDQDIISVPSILQYFSNKIEDENIDYDNSYYFSQFLEMFDIKDTDIYDPEHLKRMNTFITALDNSKTTAISTYYEHIDPIDQEHGTLFREIIDMRRYYDSLPDSNWEDNPSRKVVYFVSSCREYLE
jgi:hypothetical protein